MTVRTGFIHSVEFAPWHVDALTRCERPDTDDLLLGDAPPWAVFATFPSQTLITENHQILACCGIVPTSQKGGEVWAIFAQDAALHAMQVVHMLRRLLTEHGASMDRLHTTVRVSAASSGRLMACLGFVPQCCKDCGSSIYLDQYKHGEPYQLYERLTWPKPVPPLEQAPGS